MKKLLFKRAALLLLVAFSSSGCFDKGHQNKSTHGTNDHAIAHPVTASKKIVALSDVWSVIVSDQKILSLKPGHHLQDEDVWLFEKLVFPKTANFDDALTLTRLRTLISDAFTDGSEIKVLCEPSSLLNPNRDLKAALVGSYDSEFFQGVEAGKQAGDIDLNSLSDLQEIDKITLLYLVVNQSKKWNENDLNKACNILNKVFYEDDISVAYKLDHLEWFWNIRGVSF